MRSALDTNEEVEMLLSSLVLLLALTNVFPVPTGKACCIRTFDKGSFQVLENTGRCFDFSANGQLLWYLSTDGKTNCVGVSSAGKAMGPSPDDKTAPLTRFHWKCMLEEMPEDRKATNGGKSLERDFEIPAQITWFRLCQFQFNCTSEPSFFLSSAWIGNSRCALFRTDFSTYKIERLIVDDLGLAYAACFSESQTNVCVYSILPDESSSIYFHSGAFERIDERFVKESVRVSRSEITTALGEGRLKYIEATFLSESILAISTSSAGRYSFFGRGYLLLYDFRKAKIVWMRKSQSQFFTSKSVEVRLKDLALSSDERYLAVKVSDKIYLYDMSEQHDGL